jgi:hypothetical protein
MNADCSDRAAMTDLRGRTNTLENKAISMRADRRRTRWCAVHPREEMRAFAEASEMASLLKEAAVLHQNALVLNDLDAGLRKLLGHGVIANAQLQPNRARLLRENVAHVFFDV